MKNYQVIKKQYLINLGIEDYWIVKIGEREYPCGFEKESHAYVYLGLILQGLSLNDCSYISKYIVTMVEGLPIER